MESSCKLVILVPFLLALLFSNALGRTLLSSSNQVPEFGIEPCEDDSDCSEWINATCVDNSCNCNGSKNCPRTPEMLNLMINKIDGNCSSDATCNIEFSTCHEGKCTCPSDRVASLDGRSCLLIAEGLQGECKETVQCHIKEPNSECRQNKCMCQEHLHEVGGVCYQNAGLEGNCTKNEECSSVPFSICTSNKCSCKNGFVPNSGKNKCLMVANNMSAPCYENIQCTIPFGAAVCNPHGHCSCQELYQFKWAANRCVRDVLLGDTCMNHTDCHVPNTDTNERLECILGECKCRSSYEDINGYCVISSASSLELPHIMHLIFGCVLFLLCEY